MVLPQSLSSVEMGDGRLRGQIRITKLSTGLDVRSSPDAIGHRVFEDQFAATLQRDIHVDQVYDINITFITLAHSNLRHFPSDSLLLATNLYMDGHPELGLEYASN